MTCLHWGHGCVWFDVLWVTLLSLRKHRTKDVQRIWTLVNDVLVPSGWAAPVSVLEGFKFIVSQNASSTSSSVRTQMLRRRSMLQNKIFPVYPWRRLQALTSWRLSVIGKFSASCVAEWVWQHRDQFKALFIVFVAMEIKAACWGEGILSRFSSSNYALLQQFIPKIVLNCLMTLCRCHLQFLCW